MHRVSTRELQQREYRPPRLWVLGHLADVVRKTGGSPDNSQVWTGKP